MFLHTHGPYKSIKVNTPIMDYNLIQSSIFGSNSVLLHSNVFFIALNVQLALKVSVELEMKRME